MKNDKTSELIKLVEDYLANIDEEMEHGQYGTPECVPNEYEDEDDYYEEHEKIVDRVVQSRTKIMNFIKNYRNTISK